MTLWEVLNRIAFCVHQLKCIQNLAKDQIREHRHYLHRHAELSL